MIYTFNNFTHLNHHHLMGLIQTPAQSSGMMAEWWTAISSVVLAILTLAAVLIALFGERFWKWWEKPKIKVFFDRNSDRCCRDAILADDFVQEVGQLYLVKRQYFRLRVVNHGKMTIKNLKAKVEIFDLTLNHLGERFEPSALNWISGQPQTDLAPTEDEYVNLISQIINNKDIAFPVRVELANMSPRGIGWDRFLHEFKFRVIFYADNLPKAVVKFFKFIPQQPGQPGSLEETSPFNI